MRIMKVRFYLAMAAAALLMTNCSQDEPLTQSKGGTNTLTATIEGASRSSVTDGGVFSWDEGDAIAVGNAEGGFTKFVYGEGAFTASTSIVPTGYAIYPYNDAYTACDESLPTITLPAEYAYGSTNAPMLATIGENATSLEFKHLAGLMRFRVKNIPGTATSFTLTAEGKDITGEFTPATDGTSTSISAGTEGTNKKVEITFTSVEDVMDFYVPMPVGTYEGLKVTIGGKELASAQDATNEITRGKLLLMPTMAFNDEGNLVLEGGNNVSLSANEEVSLDVNDGEEVVVEITEGATATLNLTAPANSTEGLTISDGSEEGTESGESAATLNVSADNVSTLEINTPTLTVNLTSGEYEKVEALTATNTLVIGDGVTIEELVLNGGNLVIADGATATIENIVVKDEAGLRTAVAVGGKVTLEADITLTGYDECLWIEKECEIALNGYDINHTESTVIKIKPGGKLTIGGEGTVKTTDSACGAIANLGGTLIINGGTYKSIGAAAIYCDRGEGDTWNLTIEDGTFEATQSTAVSLQNNNGETDEKKGLATIKGGTFTGVANVGARYDLYLCNVIATIEAANCTFTNGKGVWVQATGKDSTSNETKTYSSVVNDDTYTEDGYILNN